MSLCTDIDVRREVVNLKDDEFELTQIIAQEAFPPNDVNPYTYKCDFSSLMSIVEGISDGVGDDEAMHTLMTGAPNITYAHSERTDESGAAVFAQLENVILNGDQVDGLVNPSYGTLKRAFNNGRTRIDIFVTKDRDVFTVEDGGFVCNGVDGSCPYKCTREVSGKCSTCGHSGYLHIPVDKPIPSSAYIEMIKIWSLSLYMTNTITLCERSELPVDRRLYLSSRGDSVEYGSNWIGIEFNPLVAQSYGFIVTKIVDYGEYSDYAYLRRGSESKGKYVKDVGYIREHGYDYLCRMRQQATQLSSLYNVTSSKIPTSHIYVGKTANRMDVLCAGRKVICAGEQVDVEIPWHEGGYEVTRHMVGLRCEHGNIVDIISPVFEMSTRLGFAKMLSGDKSCNDIIAEGGQMQKKIRVVTPLKSKSYEEDVVNKCVVRLSFTKCDFPMGWRYVTGRWVGYAYPNAYVGHDGYYYHKGKLIEPSDYYAPDLRINGDIIRADGDVTYIYHKVKEGGQGYYVHGRDPPVQDHKVLTTSGRREDGVVTQFGTICSGTELSMRYLYDTVPNSVYGDASKVYYDASVASDKLYYTNTSIDSSLCGDMSIEDFYYTQSSEASCHSYYVDTLPLKVEMVNPVLHKLIGHTF